MRYVRRGWRQIRPGDRIKDPRTGHRVVLDVTSYGYRLQPDALCRYTWMNPWPKVGRLKVLDEWPPPAGFPACLHKDHDGEEIDVTRMCDPVRVLLMPCGGVRREEHT